MADRAREIVLPCGLALNAGARGKWIMEATGGFWLSIEETGNGVSCFTGSIEWRYETHAEAIEKANKCVLSLRSALGFDAAIRAERERAIEQAAEVVQDEIVAAFQRVLPDARREFRAHVALSAAGAIRALLAPPPAGEPKCRDCGGSGRLPCNTVMCKDKPSHPCPTCAPRAEVQAELAARGIDVTEATEKVLAAVHARRPSPPPPPAAACETCKGFGLRVSTNTRPPDDQPEPDVCGECGGSGNDPACAKGAAS